MTSQPPLFHGLAPTLVLFDGPGRHPEPGEVCGGCGAAYARGRGRPRKVPLCPKCLQNGSSDQRLRTYAVLALGAVLDRRLRLRQRRARAVMDQFCAAAGCRDADALRSIAPEVGKALGRAVRMGWPGGPEWRGLKGVQDRARHRGLQARVQAAIEAAVLRFAAVASSRGNSAKVEEACES